MTVTLKQDLIIGGHLKEAGRVIEVTNTYGKELIRDGIAHITLAQKIEKVITNKRKKRWEQRV